MKRLFAGMKRLLLFATLAVPLVLATKYNMEHGTGCYREICDVSPDTSESWRNHKMSPEEQHFGEIFFKGLFPFVALVLLWSVFGPKISMGLREVHASPKGLPLNAEFLLYLFLTPQSCDPLVGDLEERYRLIRRRFGKGRANFWYWTQVFISLRPIIWTWMKRMSGVLALIEVYKRSRQ